MSTRSDTDTLLGARLGSCVLERAVGRGGMGAVYLARQEHPRRQVAVKVVRPRPGDDPANWAVFLDRFRAEADAAAALDHTNIVPVYEFGEVDGAAYLVMPYLADGSLDDLLARSRTPLPLYLVVSYVSQVAAALDHAHTHGIVHRDVKPSNVLLHADGRVLLADFGIAHALQPTDPFATVPDPARRPTPPTHTALTLAGSLLGTPEYVAPEQIRGDAITAAADIYALGALTYTLLVGHPPFYGEATGQILRQHLTDSPPPLRSLRPDVPPAMDAAMAWALAKRPQDRPASAGAFAAALHGSPAAGTTSARFRTSAPAYLPVPPLTPTRLPDATQTLFTLAANSPQAQFSGGADANANNAPTLYDPIFTGRPHAPVAAGPRPWPGPGPRWQGTRATSRAKTRGWPSWSMLAAIVSGAIAFVLVLGLLAHLAPARPPSHGPFAAARATPTATVTPTPTATPVINWLTVSPASVSLGCDASSQSVRVILRNLGPQDVWWAASYSWFGGVSVDPLFGPLPSGNTITVTIKNTSLAIFGPGNQGTITFTPNVSAAGEPPTLSYTTQGCQN